MANNPGTKITIEVQAMLDEATGKLNALFNTIGEGSKKVEKSNEGVVKASGGIKQLKESSALAREAFEGLQGVVLMLGGPHLEILSRGVMTARMGLHSLKSSAQLAGIELGGMVPAIAAVGLAVGAGVLMWKQYADETAKAAEKTRLMNEALAALPKTVGNIKTLVATNLLPASDATKMLEGMGAVPKGVGKYELGTPPAGGPRATRAGMWGIMNAAPDLARLMGEVRPSGMKEAQDELVKRGLLMKTGDEKNPQYELSPQIEALQKIQELERQVHAESVSGYRKEKEEAKLAYDEMVKNAESLAAVAGKFYDSDKLAALKKGMADWYQSQVGGIDFKRQQEQEKQASEAASRRKEELARDAKEQQEKLERELTLRAAEEGKNREEVYERDYQARMRLLQELLYSGLVTEQEYTAGVQSATTQRLELRKREMEKVIAQQNAQNEINLARIQGQRQLVSKDQDMTRLQRQAALGDLLRQENQLLEQNIALNRSRVADTSLDPTAHLTAAKQLQDLELRQAENQQAMADLQAQSSFIGSMRRGINELNNAWSDLGKNFADTALNSMQLSVQAVSQSITDAIWRTRSWGQAFSQIGKTIVSSLIQIVTQYVASKLAMMAIDAIYHKQSQAQAAATTATSGAAGVAQAGAQGGWVGVLIYLAVFAAAIAAVMAIAAGISGGFAEGGRPPVGRTAIVGERGPELFVPDVPGTILPADQTAAALRGGGGGWGLAGGTAVEKSTRVVIVSDERRLRDMETDPEFRNMIVRINEENRWRYR